MALVWRRRFFIACVTVIGFAILAAAVLSMRDVYTATATLVLERNETQMLEAVTQIQGAERDRIAVETEMDIIESRIFAGRIVDEFNLVNNPRYNTYLAKADEEPTPAQAVRDLIGQVVAFAARTLDMELAEEASDLPDVEVQRDRAISSFLSDLSLTRSRESLAVNVHVQSPEAQLSSALADAVARIYVSWSRDRTRQEMGEAVSFLRDRATRIATRIAENERAIADLIQENQLSSGGRIDVVRQRIDEMNSQLTTARVELSALNARQEEGRRVLAGVDDIEESALTSTLLSSLRGDWARLKREQAQYSSNFGSNHPQVLTTGAALTSVGEMIESEIRRMIHELAGEKRIVENRIEQLDQQLARLQDAVHERSIAEIRMRELERDLAADQKLHDLILTRIGSLDPFSEIAKPSARIVSLAETPSKPSFPQKRRIIAGGFVGIAVLAVFLAIMLEAADVRIRSSQEINRVAQIANLANIPRIGHLALTGFRHPFAYLKHRRQSAYAEALRSLYLAFGAQTDICGSILAFTGTGRNSGCSSVALGFALSAATNGVETLYLSLDPDISGLSRQGLARSDIKDLKEPKSIEQLISDIGSVPDVAGLWAVMAPGLLDRRKNGEPVHLSQMSRLFERLRSRFDLVVVDCAPVLETEDASWLIPVLDMIALVVRFGRVSERELAGAVSRLQINKAPLVGTVLNAVDLRAQTVREPLGVLSYPQLSKAGFNT